MSLSEDDYDCPEVWEHCYVGDIVKIRVNLKMEQVPEWSKIRDTLSAFATENGLIVNTIQPVVEIVQGERQKLVKGTKKSDRHFLDSFVRRHGIDIKSAEVGRELMGE